MYDPQMKDIEPRPYFPEHSVAQLRKMLSETDLAIGKVG
jgi:hypothetical protein